MSTETNNNLDPFPIPPREYMFLVSGKNLRDNPDKFIPAGRRAHRLLLTALESAGVDVEKHIRVLDWGCGCGRVIRHWYPYHGTHEVSGTDINERMIAWCKDNLDFASFTVCPLLPPTIYGDGAFDLVFGGSVLTHLSIEAQFAWMREIWRLLAPGGVAVLTFHGSHYFVNRVYRADSVIKMFLIDDDLFATRANAEEGANSFNSFQQLSTMRKIFHPFRLLWHGPRQGILGDQDTMVLMKDSQTSNLSPFGDTRDTYEIDLGAGESALTLTATASGQSRMFFAVQKTGDISRFVVNVSLKNQDDKELGACELEVQNTREEVFFSKTLDFVPESKGQISIRFDVVPVWNCGSGKVRFKFISLA